MISPILPTIVLTPFSRRRFLRSNNWKSHLPTFNQDAVDETGMLAALRAHRAELIDPLIAKRGGRIVKTMGDGLLLEFPSVVNATLNRTKPSTNLSSVQRDTAEL